MTYCQSLQSYELMLMPFCGGLLDAYLATLFLPFLERIGGENKMQKLLG